MHSGGNAPSLAGGRRAVTTEAILDAAEKLFSERGYAAVSVRDIGREAGVSHALVHRYLGPKEAVFRAVMRRHQDTILNAIGDADDFKDALVRALHHALAEHRSYLRLVVLSALQGLPYTTTTGSAPAVLRLIELAEAEAAGSTAPGETGLPPRIVVMAIVTLMLGWSALEPWIIPGAGLEGLDEATAVAGVTQMGLEIAALREDSSQQPIPAAKPATSASHRAHLSRRQTTTEAILDAAETLFAQKGFAAVSVRDIGARAGVSHALVHRYLGSKEDIYHAVLGRNEAAIRAAAGESDDLVEAVGRMLREGLSHSRQYLCIVAQSAVQGMPFTASIGHFPATQRLVELAETRCPRRSGVGNGLTPRFVIAAIVSLNIGWIAVRSWIRPAGGLESLDDAALDGYLERLILGLVARLLPPCQPARPAADLPADAGGAGASGG